MSNLALVHTLPKKSVYPQIMSYLNSISNESLNTKKTYLTALQMFFDATRHKTLENLTDDDLGYNLCEIEQYQQLLLRKYKRTTVNVKMNAVKKLFEKLHKYGLNVDLTAFDVKKVKVHDQESYGSLNPQEMDAIIKFLVDQGKVQQSLLVRLAYETAFRKTSMLDLTWGNFTERAGDVLVRCVGKGNVIDTKRITKTLYQDLLDNKTDDNKVFTFSSSTVQRMMDSINEHFDFGDRSITFRSFKKASIEEVGRLTNNDLKLMQRHGNHASVTTTLTSYLSRKDVEDLVIVDSTFEENENMYVFSLTSGQVYDIIKSMNQEEQERFKEIAKQKGYV